MFTEAKLSTLCGSRFSKDRWYVVVTSLVDTLKYDREYKRVGEVKGAGQIYGPILSLLVCASRCWEETQRELGGDARRGKGQQDERGVYGMCPFSLTIYNESCPDLSLARTVSRKYLYLRRCAGNEFPS